MEPRYRWQLFTLYNALPIQPAAQQDRLGADMHGVQLQLQRQVRQRPKNSERGAPFFRGNLSNCQDSLRTGVRKLKSLSGVCPPCCNSRPWVESRLPVPSFSGQLSAHCSNSPKPPARRGGPCPTGPFGPNGVDPDPPNSPNFPDFSCIQKNCSCSACQTLWPQTKTCPDLHSVPPDLVRPAMMANQTPAAGRRVRDTAPAYAHTEAYHALYLPTDWKPADESSSISSRKFPVIVEYMGNGPWKEENKGYPPDVSSGRPEDR